MKRKNKQQTNLYGDYNVASDVIANSVAKQTNKKPPTFGGGGGGYGGSDGTQMRPPTASSNAPGVGGEVPRPMTSVKGAGYTSHGKAPSNRANFDPFNQQADLGPAPPLAKKSAESPELQARDMERLVNKLIEESAAANVGGDVALALEKAKEAGKKERMLCRHRDKNGLSDQINFDLTYAVCFNLAHQYHAMKMYTEALNTYTIVVKNKQYPQAGRLRVNMGNIFYEQKKYPSAIKMYRMAMDLIGTASREMRFKIMRNIGNAFVRLGQFQDGIQSYEAIMEAHGDPQTGFNLIVCYYALGNRDKMKKGFMQLLSVQEFLDDEEDAEDVEEKSISSNDDLRRDRKDRRLVTHRYVRMAAKLIAPVIEKDISEGFDWVIEYLRTPRRPNSPHSQGTDIGRQGFPSIAMEMAIAKGIAFLKRKNYKAAVDVFKSFEKKDGLIDQAATNLSFLYFLEGDNKNAEKYADLAVRADRYNAKALVNRANYIFSKGDMESARELYLEAIGVEADCVEAIYNLGLSNKRLGHLEESLQAFKKLHRIIPKDPQVIYHIANLYDLLQDPQQAAKWFKILHGSVPSDPKVLARLGNLYNKEDDETQAFHNFSDSYTCYPVNMEVISWLGVWYVKSELYEDAIQFFERAAEIEPGEVKWQLMVASCFRRMGNLQSALDLYKRIHKQDPDNIECLRYLCTICKDMNDQDYDEYNKLLRKAERAAIQAESKFMKEDKEVGDGDLATNNMLPDDGKESYQSKEMDDQFNADVAEREQGASLADRSKKADEDDWGDEELGEDLLPL